MRKLLLLALFLPAPALAQPAPCVVDAGLDGPLAAWRTPASGLRLGAAAEVPTGQAVSNEIAEAGTYGFAPSIGAWIDVARGGQVLQSTAHGHGPACSSIRKIVDFRLEPGSYTITLSRTDAPSARLLVFRR